MLASGTLQCPSFVSDSKRKVRQPGENVFPSPYNVRKNAIKSAFSPADNFNLTNPKDAEYVSVWRRDPGPTLTVPALANMLTVMAQSDSMEVGEEQYAFAGRLVIRVLKMGHEIKGGQRAGSSQYHYKKEAGDAWLNFLRTKLGLVDLCEDGVSFVEWPVAGTPWTAPEGRVDIAIVSPRRRSMRSREMPRMPSSPCSICGRSSVMVTLNT